MGVEEIGGGGRGGRGVGRGGGRGKRRRSDKRNISTVLRALTKLYEH